MNSAPHKPNVLIVEDDQDQARALGRVLRVSNMAFETSGSLAEGLVRLAGGGVDCVILDLTLPDAGGLQAANTLQQKFPDVPFVINTGHRDLAIQAIHAGAQDAVLKPGDPEAWETRIQYAIARHKVRRRFEPIMESLGKVMETQNRLIESVEPGSVRFGRINP